MSYIVMECHSAYAVVLSNDGRFLKVANMHYQVGQQVTWVEEMQLPQPEKSSIRHLPLRWIGTVGAMAACLLLVFGNLFMNFMPYASVYMAINPEVRIDVSRTDLVLGVTGINPDGEQLILDYHPQKQPLDVVMDELVDRAVDLGYLHEGGTITLTLDGSDRWIADHEGTLDSHLAAHLSDKVSVTIDLEIPVLDTQPPVQSTSSGVSTVIPVESDSNYGDSAYDKQDNSDSGYDDDSNEPDDSATPYDDDKSSPYDNDKSTPYDNDKSTPYDDSSSPYQEKKDSRYDKKEDGQTDYGPQDKSSRYDDDDGDTPYQKKSSSTHNSKGNSDYDKGGSGYDDDDDD